MSKMRERRGATVGREEKEEEEEEEPLQRDGDVSVTSWASLINGVREAWKCQVGNYSQA